MHQYECWLCDAVVEYGANDRHPADWVEAGLCDQCYHQLAALATRLPPSGGFHCEICEIAYVPTAELEYGLCPSCSAACQAAPPHGTLPPPLPLLPGEERFMDQRAGNYRFSLN